MKERCADYMFLGQPDTWNKGSLKGWMFPLGFPLGMEVKGKRNFSLKQGLQGGPLEEAEPRANTGCLKRLCDQQLPLEGQLQKLLLIVLRVTITMSSPREFLLWNSSDFILIPMADVCKRIKQIEFKFSTGLH